MIATIDCDSCGRVKECRAYQLPAIINKEKGIVKDRTYFLCDECALTIAELIEKEI